jgi:hypothetical protein
MSKYFHLFLCVCVFVCVTWHNQLGGGHTSEDHGSTSESLNIYPEACGGENTDMLESARLSVSLEGDENFRVGFYFYYGF